MPAQNRPDQPNQAKMFVYGNEIKDLEGWSTNWPTVLAGYDPSFGLLAGGDPGGQSFHADRQTRGHVLCMKWSCAVATLAPRKRSQHWTGAHRRIPRKRCLIVARTTFRDMLAAHRPMQEHDCD